MDLNKFKVTIGGKSVNVTAFTPDTTATKAAGKTHHVLLIDRSGSMYSSISYLIDQVQNTVKLIGQDDLISILWFSGQGSKGVICQGVKGSEDITTVLNKFRSVLGTTCFSEPLAESTNVVAMYKDVVDQSVITLFTDGCPVVSWSTKEETERCHEIIKDLVDDLNVSAVNTVGYGNYYNRDFLQTLSEASDQGMFVHSSKIEQFTDVFTSAVEVASGLVLQSLDIEVSDDDADILYVGNGTSGLHKSDLSMRRLDKSRNLVFIVSENSKYDLTINGVTDHKIESMTQSSNPEFVENFLYSYADSLYYRGERQKALDIIVNNLRDKHLADLMMNAFTIDEVADVQKALNIACEFKSERYISGKCGVGYLPKKDAFCLMDLFNLFFKKDVTAYYVPFSKNVEEYQRIGRKVTDEFNLFTKSPEEVIVPLNDFVWNKDKLNLSIRILIPGTVTLNPKAAKTVGLASTYPSKIYRNHTFIKDGQLNIKTAEFLLSSDVLEVLNANKIGNRILSTDEDVGGILLNRVVVDLTKLPVINRLYIDNSDSLDDLKDIVVNISKAEASIKVAKDALATVLASNVNLTKVGAYKGLTADQITVLENHGISKDGVYGGIDNVKPKAADSDSYEVRTLEFYLKGFSSLPSIADFNKMLNGEKRVNAPGQMMIDYLKDLEFRLKAENLSLNQPNAAVRDFLNEELEELKAGLATARNHLNAVKMAKVLTHDFFHGLVADDKGNYSYGDENHTMILRNDRTVEYV
ncbi:Von Willebrand factor type A domain-containing protein [Rhizobium phage RHph_TM40]|uniref:von Willebrand factor type A domain-containing protein n=1 Tax=Rhizobium phage RHph_TM30 TaxID=2509764 RepID=A0A7S5R5A8_9CAUD|nr:Von Willebrand factor type A domain-containing protein [Rhizobium phage RHph_TM30]QIG71352.1 Von Willebrand factor type A domain-containing protein [Rhizobium phage RHph_TM30]QIG71716.1 Von Willebrand factor type A domain-containing protein [Rhizobium phage RHph_TM40]QIG72079.1 Von Willebrand factor type A domain-containing protein [Rhizobium phage RHph_TM2_3B]